MSQPEKHPLQSGKTGKGGQGESFKHEAKNGTLFPSVSEPAPTTVSSHRDLDSLAAKRNAVFENG